MPKQVSKLSARAATTLTKPGRHSDGDGLYLNVTVNGAKSWVFLYNAAGRRREMGLGTDTDRFLLHLFAALAERERRVIGERTRLALAAAKARGVKLGGTNQQSLANRDAARARAEKLRPVLVERASMSARAASIELNRRKIATPTGARWHPETVSRVRQRLAAISKRD